MIHLFCINIDWGNYDLFAFGAAGKSIKFYLKS